MRLPSVYCAVTSIPRLPRPRPIAVRQGLGSPLRGHGRVAVRRGAPSRHAEPGNGGRRYRQTGAMSKEATAGGAWRARQRPVAGAGQVGSTSASGPAMSS